MVPVSTSTGTLNVSPEYRGLVGRRAYPPVAEGVGGAGAATTVKASKLVVATTEPEYEILTTTEPVEAVANQEAGTLYTQSPLPTELTDEQPSAAENPLLVEMNAVADRLLSTLKCPAASTTKKASHKVDESIYTVAVLRIARTATARLSETAYAGLVAKSWPPDVELPETKSAREAEVPRGLLKKAERG